MFWNSFKDKMRWLHAIFYKNNLYSIIICSHLIPSLEVFDADFCTSLVLLVFLHQQLFATSNITVKQKTLIIMNTVLL